MHGNNTLCQDRILLSLTFQALGYQCNTYISLSKETMNTERFNYSQHQEIQSTIYSTCLYIAISTDFFSLVFLEKFKSKHRP